MGDERRDFDTPGRTNGQDDQTKPVPSQDETQPFAAPDQTMESGAVDGTPPAGRSPDETAAGDETQPFVVRDASPAGPDETQPFVVRDASPAGPDETQPFAGPDETQPFAGPDETRPFAPSEGARPFRPVEEPDHAPQPSPAAWSGRAGVPGPGPSLRDSAPYTREVPPPQQPRPWWTPVLLGVLALGLVGVLFLVAWWMGRDDSPPPVEIPSASVIVPTGPTEPTVGPTTPAASPTAQIVQVPRLVGLSLDDALAQLDRLGLSYRLEYRPADEPEGTVIEASPPEGLVVPVQTTVTLIISTGRERSPTPSPTQGAAASATPGN